MNVIETHNLSKSFGNTSAVKNVSIHVQEGEIYGFLGLNGAGKTTLIRMLLKLIKADVGEVLLFGQKPEKSADIWNEVGYLVETPFSYPNLSVRENLELIFKLRKLENEHLIDQIIEQLYLTPYRNKKAAHLSLGNNQRLGLAKALIHQPKLLILDEPTNGLDPAGIVEIRGFLKELVQQKKVTVFVSSHILTEVAKISDRIGIIHQGSLIKELEIGELRDQIEKVLLIDTVNNAEAVKFLTRNKLKVNLNGDQLIESRDRDVLTRPELLSALLAKEGLAPRMINIVKEDLETYFLRTIRS